MVIELNNVIEGTIGTLRNAGVPVNGASEVQTLTFGGTWLGTDTFKLSHGGYTSAPIAWSATNATLVANIDAALESLPSIGAGGVATATSGVVTSGIGVIAVTFGGNLANQSVALIAVSNNTSAAGTLAIAETTPGVTASGRGAAVGATLLDTTGAKEYINTGTQASPIWIVKGTQV